MSLCAATSSTNRVLAVSTSSCRLRKTRTLASVHHTGDISSSLSSHGWSRNFTASKPTSNARRWRAGRTTSPWATRDKGAPIHCITPISRVSFSNSAAAASLFQDSAVHQNAASSGDSKNLFFSSFSLLAFTLGFVAATTSPDATGSCETTAGAKFGRTGGGGGGGSGGGGSPLKSLSSLSAQSRNSRKNAEKDVLDMEEEAKKDPYTVSAGILQGARWTMEDAYTVENGGRFVGVFDGHGGSEVSSMLRERLYDLYRDSLSLKHWESRDDFDVPRDRVPTVSSHVAALREALAQVEEDVLKEDELVYQGSTAVTVVLHVDVDGTRTLLSANVGDSRAVLSRNGKAMDLTKDHKPNDQREKARIRAMGEEVQWDPYGQVYRVRDLSLSRAIGDRFAKPYVSSEPEMKRFLVADDKDEFVLLASDGLWDVMTSQEAVDYVHYCLEHHQTTPSGHSAQKMMARLVANEALERGSADNVCVVVLWLMKEKDSKK